LTFTAPRDEAQVMSAAKHHSACPPVSWRERLVSQYY